jgi:hypothetical protein
VKTVLHSLTRRFREARLDLELLREPIATARRGARGLEQIVQIDIARPPRRASERFLLFPGGDENRLEALGVDAPHRQVVLFVEEPSRAFEVRVARGVTLPPRTRIVHEDRFARVIEQHTPGSKRHFLCGMDEQHLFVAELPYGVSSVAGAREALRAPEVPSSLRLRGGRIVRQGEWFFLPASVRERADIDAMIRLGKVFRGIGIAQAARLGRAGRPHVADEIVVLTDSGARPIPRIYVRGHVRHPDHRTIALQDFHRTVPNRERFAQAVGVLWVD